MVITDVQGTSTLHNGVKMPYLGLGVFKTKEGNEVINSVTWALEAGYRHIDTAAFYMNEEGVGEAIRRSGLKREEIFVTSKLWNSDQRSSKQQEAFELSLSKLKMEYLDLYLIHWPVEEKIHESWRILEKLYKQGKIRAIGVSNFKVHHIEKLLPEAEIIPMINQVEFHPYLVQQQLLEYCQSKGIQIEAWSPLVRGKVTDIPVLAKMSNKYGKTAAQIALRWNLQKGIITIPKSSNKSRIKENAQIFDFELESNEIDLIDNLDRKYRTGPDPDLVNF